MIAPTRLLRALTLAALIGTTVSAAPEQWRAEIDQLTAQDAAQRPAPGGIVFVGSSSIRLWKTLDRDFPGLATINRGFGGSELADSAYYFDRLVLPYQPRAVVLFAGTNDLWNGRTPEAVAASFREFRDRLRSKLPEARLLYLSVTKAPSRERVFAAVDATNRLIAAACAEDPRCEFVDVMTPLLDASGRPRPELFVGDQLHLNADGYARWTAVLAPRLKP